MLIVSTEGKFLEEIEPYLQNRDILNQLSLKEQGEAVRSKERVLLLLRDDSKCWTFVKDNLDALKHIDGWKHYRRAAKASSESIGMKARERIEDDYYKMKLRALEMDLETARKLGDEEKSRMFLKEIETIERRLHPYD